MGKRGVLIVFSGPSGVGKGTLKKRLLEEFKGQIVDSVSATTREPREGEQDGREYFFISRQEFERRVENNDFLEHAEFSGNCYGTPRENVMNLLSQGIDVVLEIDVQGARQVREKMPDCVSVFILPPSFEELEHRLRDRHTETEEKVLARLETAKREIPCADEYDYQIVNNDLDAAYDHLRSVYMQAARRA